MLVNVSMGPFSHRVSRAKSVMLVYRPPSMPAPSRARDVVLVGVIGYGPPDRSGAGVRFAVPAAVVVSRRRTVGPWETPGVAHKAYQ